MPRMAINVQRPRDIKVRIGHPPPEFAERGPSRSLAFALVGRALLIGVAIGILTMTGSGIASIAFVGVIALGAALVSWEP